MTHFFVVEVLKVDRVKERMFLHLCSITLTSSQSVCVWGGGEGGW